MIKLYLYKYFASAVVLCLLSIGVFAQRVIDPSATDRNYNAKKLATGKNHAALKQSNNIAADFGCNVDDGCFIPMDDSYIELPRNDDGSYGPVALPFNFSLYGTPYNQVYINTNGNLTFDLPLSGFVAEGFPIGIPMIAAFWQDIDTRNSESGTVYYKLTDTHLIITWDGVGYYNSHADKLNTFQIIISTLGDPILGGNNNVKFAYKSMQWALPDGTAAFGPATVGVNKGDGINYVQVGRFEKENCDYDGPAGETDGVGYLENQCFLFNVSNEDVNIPPSVTGLPVNNTITLNIGESVSISPQFIGPEVGQTVTTVVDTTGFCSATYTITNGEVSTIDMQIAGSECNVGTHVITLSATDNGLPQQTTSVNITVIVNSQGSAPEFDYSVTPTDGAEISVHPGEPVNFTVKAADNDAGDNVTLTSDNIPAGATTNPPLPASGNPVSSGFSWTPADGDIGTHLIVFKATDNSGNITTTSVTVTVSSESSCDPALRTFIRVSPRATVKGQDYHTIYKGYGLQRVLLSAIPHGGKGRFTYTWSDGKSGFARTVSPAETTTYGLILTDSRGCSVETSVTIKVVDVRCGDDNSSVLLCYNGETICVAQTEVQQWLDQGATLGSCPVSIAQQKSSGSQSAMKVKTKAEEIFKAYPNPAANFINLKYNLPSTGKATIIITDVQGRPLISQALNNSSQNINVSKLANGIYIVKLIVDNKYVASSRFMVNK